MTNIKIEEKRRLRRVTRNCRMPEHWNELTAVQLTAIARALRGDIGNDELLASMLKLKPGFVKRLDIYSKYKLGKQLEWTGKFEPHDSFIIEVTGRAHPGKDLKGMSFGQYMFVDTFHGDWAESRKAEDLDKFAGCLYLPEGETFKTESVKRYADGVSSLAEAKKSAIELNYRLIKEYLTNIYPWIFERPDPDEKQSKGPKGSWLPVFESIVGDDITHQEEYFNLPAHTMLRHISKKMKENAKNGR